MQEEGESGGIHLHDFFFHSQLIASKIIELTFRELKQFAIIWMEWVFWAIFSLGHREFPGSGNFRHVMTNRIGLRLISVGLSLACVLLSFSASASAYSQMDSYLGVGAGVYNVMDSNSRIYGLVDYRPPFGIYGIGPWITLSSNEEQTGYFSAGILRDFFLTDSIVLTPSFGIGIYNRAAGEVVLGHPVEFRSALKLSYELGEGFRIGVRFGHVSNAGLGKTNPGSEFLSLIYSFRLSGD